MGVFLRISMLVLAISSLSAWALTVTDGTASNGNGITLPTWEVRWTDNDGTERDTFRTP